jgi:hypothetical protein
MEQFPAHLDYTGIYRYCFLLRPYARVVLTE